MAIKKKSIGSMIGAAGLAVIMAAPEPVAAQETLRVVAGVPEQSVVTQVLLRRVPQINERGKGIVQFNYLGGPEVTPPAQQGQALQRGLFEVLYTPGAFYAGMVNEVDALLASNVPIAKMRENGAMDLIDKLWREQMGAHVLGWFDTTVHFHMFLNVEPKVTDEGLDLRGISLWTTPTFREFQESLGANPVRMQIGEILTGIERGVIQGYGYPEYGMTGLGLQRVTKFRIDPTYYRGNTFLLVNAKKWDSLPRNVQEFLTKEARDYEKVAHEYVRSEVDREQKILMDNGMKVIALKGDAARKYRETAHDIAWNRLLKRSPEHGPKLRELMYDPDLL